VTPSRETDPDSLVGAAKQEARKAVRKLFPALTALLMAGVLLWTARINVKANDAEDTAENAEAKGENGARVAKTAKVEARATYDVSTNKDAAIVEDMKKLTERLNVVESELELLRGRARTRRRKPIELSPETTTPPPPTPAAAAQEQGGQPP
jgi:hypothetical protein